MSELQQRLMLEANRVLEAGDLPRAESLYNNIIKNFPNYHPAYFQLGILAVQVGKLKVASELIAHAIKLNTSVMVYHRAVGEIYRRLGQLEEAVRHGRRAVELSPDDVDSLYNLGIALADSGDYEAAIGFYKKTLERNDSHAMAANNLGSALEALGQEDEALIAYRQAIAVNPDHSEAQNNIGAILSARGDLEEAKKHFAYAIKSNPSFVFAHHNLSTLKHYSSDDPDVVALETMASHLPPMSADAAEKFWFALAKSREDTGRYDAAMEAYHKGNALRRKTFDYNEAKMAEVSEEMMEVFSREYIEETSKQGCVDSTPIFIVGMPRSGTTLLEQIIASHSEVYGAGELKYIHDLARQRLADATFTKAQRIEYYQSLNYGKLGEAYIEKVRAFTQKHPHISDKMPANFFYVGLIHCVLPNAKIIHSMRSPLDTCLSNYSRLFNETMGFAYDLGELGRYYKNYERLMQHWNAVLPQGVMLEVQYEDVIADVEQQSRRILDYCGLEWQDKCLSFYKNKRHVKTASIAQVRRPIYKSSVERWRRFDKHLEPLRVALAGS